MIQSTEKSLGQTDDKMREAIDRAFEDWSSRRIGSSGLASWLAFEGGYLAASQEIEALRVGRAMADWEIGQLNRRLDELRAQVQDQAMHLISAHAQAEEAHADAQRYRWLRRDSRPCDLVQFVDVSNGCGAFGARTEDELDQAIDAALKEDHDRP